MISVSCTAFFALPPTATAAISTPDTSAASPTATAPPALAAGTKQKHQYRFHHPSHDQYQHQQEQKQEQQGERAGGAAAETAAPSLYASLTCAPCSVQGSQASSGLRSAPRSRKLARGSSHMAPSTKRILKAVPRSKTCWALAPGGRSSTGMPFEALWVMRNVVELKQR